jgi:hypothetical protein
MDAGRGCLEACSHGRAIQEIRNLCPGGMKKSLTKVAIIIKFYAIESIK